MSNGIKAKQNKDKFFTVEFWGVTLIVSAFLLLVCLLFGENVLFEIGKEVQVFILGLFGYLSYPILLVCIFVGFTMLIGKKKEKKRSLAKFKRLFIFIFLVLCLLTVITGHKEPSSYAEYLGYCFKSARVSASSCVAGGALLSLITFFLVRYLTYFWSVTILIACLSIFVLMLLVRATKKANDMGKGEQPKQAEGSEPQPQPQVQPQYQPPQAPYQPPYQPQQNFGYTQSPYGAQPNGYMGGYPQQPITQPPFAPQRPNEFNGYERNELYGNQSHEYNNPPAYQDVDKHDANMQILYGNRPNTYSEAYSEGFSSGELRVDDSDREQARQVLFGDGVSSPIKKEEVVKDYTVDDSFSFNLQPKQEEPVQEVTAEPVIDSEPIVDSEPIESYEEPVQESVGISDAVSSTASDLLKNLTTTEPTPKATKPVSKEPEVVEVDEGSEYAKRLIENMPLNYKYKKPPISIFKTADNSQNNYEIEVFKAEVKAKILTTLKTFGIETDIPRIFKGPAVTRFDIAIPPDVPIAKVTKLQGDLNLRIAAKSAIRMIAPVPNTSYVGIEVPNKEADTVNIKDIIVSDQFINSKPFSLTFALGKDIIGTPVSLDLADMPHALVTGTTGSGKSVCLNTLILSLITKYGPDELRFVIVDPKRVDLEPFKEIPHMMFGEIIEDVPMTNSMLTWAVEEMENRYRELAKSRSKNIKDYNVKARANGERIMPRIVIIMDEFADIMLQDKKGVATKVCLLAQKARAAGIHLVLAAQRPSVDVVEGPIKSNLPSRIVFRASSTPDSIVSLGEPGAEKLLGKGDCLYKTGGMLSVERVMGAYVSDDEMYAVIDYVSQNNDKYYDLNNWSKIKARVSSTSSEDSGSYEGGEAVSGGGEDGAVGGIDPIYIKAMRVGYSFGGLSMSFLQRKLAVGFPKAGKIIDWLTDNGYITPNAVGGKRQMVMTKEDFEEKFGAE
ncbi:MAG: hypothetical protein IJA97_06240 [Clostridia bacterium]|nr:hypothetical protein [Clostridia bacterium]